MNTPTHTPGPWIIRTRQNLTAICTPKGEMQLSLHGVHDGLKPLSVSLQEWLANAHLTAAAPAMYEALTDAERMWNIARIIDSKHHAGNPISNDLWSDFHRYLMEWHTKRKSALAQAEGKL